jgi:hypothetical protein
MPFVAIVFLILSITLSVSPSYSQQNIKPFEQRLIEEISVSNQSLPNPTNTSNLITNSTLLDLPRNSTLSQIQAGNESISKLYNSSLQNMGASTEKTRQNLTDILSILK